MTCAPLLLTGVYNLVQVCNERAHAHPVRPCTSPPRPSPYPERVSSGPACAPLLSAPKRAPRLAARSAAPLLRGGDREVDVDLAFVALGLLGVRVSAVCAVLSAQLAACGEGKSQTSQRAIERWNRWAGLCRHRGDAACRRGAVAELTCRPTSSPAAPAAPDDHLRSSRGRSRPSAALQQLQQLLTAAAASA